MASHEGAPGRTKFDWRIYIPKSITVIAQEGYRLSDFRADALAGLTVAIVALTVLVDLTVAITVGIVLAAIIFMHRMAESTAIAKGVSLIQRDQDDFSGPARDAYMARRELPKDVEMFELRGPLFFGAASRLNDAFEAAFPSPKVFILRFDAVPMVDVSGVGALSRFLKRCEAHGTRVLITELNARSHALLRRMGVLDLANVEVIERYGDAVQRASDLTGQDGV